ncbi:MAG: hypothetical protein ACLFPX_07130 [Candidatus Omnitrophota bacterium]
MLKSDPRKAQTSLEFAFAMIVAALLLLGMIKVMLWVGKDLVARRTAHESVLTGTGSPVTQVRPTFYYSTPIDAAKDSNIFDPNY